MTSYSPSLLHPYPYIISIITILPILIHSPRSYTLLTYCRLRYIIQICNDYYGWFTETNGTYRILSNSNTCVSYNTFFVDFRNIANGYYRTLPNSSWAQYLDTKQMVDVQVYSDYQLVLDLIRVHCSSGSCTSQQLSIRSKSLEWIESYILQYTNWVALYHHHELIVKYTKSHSLLVITTSLFRALQTEIQRSFLLRGTVTSLQKPPQN